MTISRHHRRHLDRRHRRMFTDHGRVTFAFDARTLTASQLHTDAAPSDLFGPDPDERRYAVEIRLAPPNSIVSAAAAVAAERTDCEPLWHITSYCEHIRAAVPLEALLSTDAIAQLQALFLECPTHWLVIAIGREQL